MDRRMTRGKGLGPAIAASAALVCLLVAGPVHSASGCVRVPLDAPVLLPDGNFYPAGSLTICDSISLSPVTSIHKTFVNGRPVGLLASRRRASEVSADTAPFVVFHRDSFGRLELVGYVLPARSSSGRSTTFVLVEGREIAEAEAWNATLRGNGGPVIALAASGP